MNLQVPLVAPWRIGIDVGGTFTDLVALDDSGRTLVVKVASTPEDPSVAVIDAIEAAASKSGLFPTRLLEGCSRLLHGSTIATNTLLEGRYARVGLLLNAGLRDALEIRRGIRDDQWDHRRPFAPVLVPRYARLPVRGRLDRTGRELESLSRDDVEAAIRAFSDLGVESVAICFLHSSISPVHEQRAAEQVERALPGIPVTVSSSIRAIVGEYERTATAVVNAALVPIVSPYLSALAERLRELGLRRPPLLMQSNGGVISVDRARTRPVELLLSGPAAGVGALEQLAAHDSENEERFDGNLLSLEIGGTSCDVLSMAGGRVESRETLDVAGYRMATPAVDIHTVGAGGGTIARVDRAGLLYVGPRGAGARPGPASYGLGGDEPTVTDAQLVLGRLRSGAISSSRLELDRSLARRAIEQRIARPLGVSTEDAAVGILRLLEQHLVQAVETVSTQRGLDAAKFLLVAGGGAGPLHVATVARRLGIEHALVPRRSGVFCAEGLLFSDVRMDFERPLLLPLDGVTGAAMECLAELREQAEAALEQEGFAPADRRIETELELRYRDQSGSLFVEVNEPLEQGEIRRAFERQHLRLYGHVQPRGTIQVAAARARAFGLLSRQKIQSHRLDPVSERSGESPRPCEHRRVYVDEAMGWAEIPVYRGDELAVGTRLTGPLLVEEQTTTLLLGAADRLEVDAQGDYRLALPARRSTTKSDQGREIDPVILALVQHRLDYISRRMGWVMTRTARSPIFSQAHDFSCFSTDERGRLISAADGIPIHSGGGGLAVRALIEAFSKELPSGLHDDVLDDVLEDVPLDIHPGDVFVLNDPYAAGGNHLPDWVIARPVFVDERLIAFACNRAHQSDIGGGAAGTYNPEATEIYQEGIRLPPLRLIEAGETRDDLWQLLLLNSRTPELLDGDLRAMIGSTRIGTEQIVELSQELGAARLLECFEGVLAHGERSARAAIGALPDGVYRATESTWGDCFDDREIPIAVTLTVEGETMKIDFSGTDPQVRGFKNSSIANTTSAVLMALVSFFDEALPRNEGVLRAVELEMPEGTIVNPRHPAPVTMCTVFVAHEIVHAIWRALAQADPERGCAGWGKSITGVTSGSVGEREPYVLYHWNALPGTGAVQGRDGFNQLGHLITLGGLTLPDVESCEHRYPVTISRQEFRLDGGGAGRWRGGTGVDYEISVETEALYSFRGEGLLGGGGFGLSGGGSGAEGEMTLIDADGRETEAPRYGLELRAPCRVRAASPGGGGWGDPLERDPEAVLRDVLDEVVSLEAARRQYGVVVAGDPAEIDQSATRVLRARLSS